MGQGWGTPVRASPQWRRMPGTVGSQGLTRGTEGLLHQAHLHHLQGQTSQMTPSVSRIVHCPSPPHPQPQLPTGPQHTHPHKGYKLLAGVLVGAAQGREAGQGLGVLSTECHAAALWPRDPHAGRDQCWLRQPLGPSALALPPMRPPVPDMAAQGTLHKEARSQPLQCWERTCMREGSPAPLWGHGSSARQEGWTHIGERRGARQRHSKHKPIPDIKIKIETSLPWVPETKRRER